MSTKNESFGCNIIFDADNLYSIGASAASRPANIYAATAMFAAGSAVLTVANFASNAFPLLAPSGSATAPTYSFSAQTNTGTYLIGDGTLGLTVFGSLGLQIGGSIIDIFGSRDLVWNTDGGGNIGQGVANRPNNINAKLAITAGTDVTATSGKFLNNSTNYMQITSNTQIDFFVNGLDYLTIGGSFLVLSHNQELAWNTDGGGNIGSASANRPLNLFLKSFATLGQIATPASPAASNNSLYFKSDNNLYMLNSSGVETQVNGGSTSFPLLAPNGSAAAPSYSFSASTGTGMWSSATNTLSFSTAGVKVFEINSTGGTTQNSTSSSTLNNSGTTNDTQALTLNSTIHGTTTTLAPSAGAGVYGLYSQCVGTNSTTGAGAAAVAAYTSGSNYGIGVHAIALGGSGTSPRLFGVIGKVSLTGVAATSYAAGYFYLNTADVGNFIPSGVTAALVANNGNTAADILHLQSNASDRLTVLDSGSTTISMVGGSTPGLTVDSGTSNQALLSLKINGVQIVSVLSTGDGSTGTVRVIHTSKIGTELDPYGYYCNVGQSDGQNGNPFSGTGTYGAYFNAVSSGATSTNTGTVGYAFAGNKNVGVWGISDTVTGTTPRAIGVMGTASNVGTPTTQIGGYFAITNTQANVGTYPASGTISALVANNGNSAADILHLQNNGADVFTVAGKGNTVIDCSASTTSTGALIIKVPIDNGTYNNAHATGILVSVPAGSLTTTTGSASIIKVNASIDASGASNRANYLFAALDSGFYTGTGNGSSMMGYYASLNPGNFPGLLSISGATGVFGAFFNAINGNTTTGTGTAGIVGAVGNSVNQVGADGYAGDGGNVVNVKTIGVRGTASGGTSNGGTTTYATQIGGFFAIGTTDNSTLADKFPALKCALVADNTNTGFDILHLQSGGTDRMWVTDGGSVQVSPTVNTTGVEITGAATTAGYYANFHGTFGSGAGSGLRTSVLRVALTLGGGVGGTVLGIDLIVDGTGASGTSSTFGIYMDIQKGATSVVDLYNGGASCGIFMANRSSGVTAAGKGNTGIFANSTSGNVIKGIVSINESAGGTSPVSIASTFTVIKNAVTPTTYAAIHAFMHSTSDATRYNKNPFANAVVVIDNGDTSDDLLNLGNNSSSVFKVASTGTLTVSGQFLGSNGTSASTAYGFAAENGIGMYRNGASSLAFSAGNTQVMEMQTTGIYAEINLVSYTDNAYDWGRNSSGTRYRPKDFYTAGDHYIGGTSGGSNTSTSKIYFGSQNTATTFISSSEVVLTETTTPSTPASASHALYFKSDNNLYMLNSAGSEVQVNGATTFASSQVIGDSPNGFGSTGNTIRRWTNTTTVGTDITYADSSTNGMTLTINTAGLYAISYSDQNSGGAEIIGWSINSNQLSTNIASITTANRLILTACVSTSFGCVATVVRCAVNDVLRTHTNGNANSTSSTAQFRIVRIG